MVGASQQMIDLPREGRRSSVLAQRGEVGGYLAVEQGQLLQLGAGEPLQPAAVSRGHQSGQPVPVWPAFLNPVVGEDSGHGA